MNIQEFKDLFDSVAAEQFVLTTNVIDMRDRLARLLIEKGFLHPVPLGINISDKIEMKGT